MVGKGGESGWASLRSRDAQSENDRLCLQFSPALQVNFEVAIGAFNCADLSFHEGVREAGGEVWKIRGLGVC